jgi:hypothetical protein
MEEMQATPRAFRSVHKRLNEDAQLPAPTALRRSSRIAAQQSQQQPPQQPEGEAHPQKEQRHSEESSRPSKKQRPGPIKGRKGLWNAECILDEMWDPVQECILYLTQWEGYPRSAATWEPPHHFVTSHHIDIWKGQNSKDMFKAGEMFLTEEPTAEEEAEANAALRGVTGCNLDIAGEVPGQPQDRYESCQADI